MTGQGVHLLEDLVGDPPEFLGKMLQISERPKQKLSPGLGCSMQAATPCWLLGIVWRRSCLQSGCSQTLIFFLRLLTN